MHGPSAELRCNLTLKREVVYATGENWLLPFGKWEMMLTVVCFHCGGKGRERWI
jgi:hypothetical protein